MMLLAHAMRTLLAHVVQLVGRQREGLFNRVREQRHRTGRDEPAADGGLDELGDSGDIGRYDGTLQGKCFHNDDWEPFGKAGKNHGA